MRNLSKEVRRVGCLNWFQNVFMPAVESEPRDEIHSSIRYELLLLVWREIGASTYWQINNLTKGEE